MLGPGPVGIGEEQVSFGVEIEIVRPFEQLIAPRIDQCLQLFSLWIVGQNATVPRGQIEFPVVPPSALGLAGLPEIVGRVAIDHRDQFAIGRQVRNPAAADRHKPQITLLVERAAF